MEITKGEVSSFKMFVVFTILLLVFFIADLCLSCINVCHVVDGAYQCKLVPVIDMLPMIR
jgi:hypothetical protein